METFVAENQTRVDLWDEAFSAVQAPDVLDFAAFERQRTVIQNYIRQTELHEQRFVRMIDLLKSRLAALGPNHEMAQGAIEAVEKKYALQKPVMEPLMEAHKAYGATMIEMLDRLQREHGNWTTRDGNLVFEDDRTRTEFNRLVDILLRHESEVNDLTDALIERM